MVWEPAPKWHAPPPATGTCDIIVWHVRPDTNWQTHEDFKKHMKIVEWDKSKPFPDRDVAYAYQTGKGTWRKPYYGVRTWTIELDGLSPMVYFGEAVYQHHDLYCRDDHGELHGPLDDGETIEPIVKGEITITHSKPPKRWPGDTQGDWDE
jgi:hypothetical protein